MNIHEFHRDMNDAHVHGSHARREGVTSINGLSSKDRLEVLGCHLFLSESTSAQDQPEDTYFAASGMTQPTDMQSKKFDRGEKRKILVSNGTKTHKKIKKGRRRMRVKGNDVLSTKSQKELPSRRKSYCELCRRVEPTCNLQVLMGTWACAECVNAEIESFGEYESYYRRAYGEE